MTIDTAINIYRERGEKKNQWQGTGFFFKPLHPEHTCDRIEIQFTTSSRLQTIKNVE